MLRWLALTLFICEALCTSSCTSTGSQTPSEKINQTEGLPVSSSKSEVAVTAERADKEPQAKQDILAAQPAEQEFLGIKDGSLVNARCPNAQDFANLNNIILNLGDETKALVKDDVEILKQASDRHDLVGIASCCSQMEQMVQDAEVMNEDRPAVEESLKNLRLLHKTLCPHRKN